MNRLSRWSLLLGLAVLIAAGAQFLFLDWTSDDAYISFRYAENLSGGRGLVFNAGEKVEGYSNFLWVVLLAAGNFLGLAPVWTAKALGFLSVVYLIFALYYAAGLFCLSRAVRALCVLMLSLTAGCHVGHGPGCRTAGQRQKLS